MMSDMSRHWFGDWPVLGSVSLLNAKILASPERHTQGWGPMSEHRAAAELAPRVGPRLLVTKMA